MVRWSYGLVSLFLYTPCVQAQGNPSRLTQAVRDGAESMTSARLDRLADMATVDLAPLDEGTSEVAPSPWPGGEPAAETQWSSCGMGSSVTGVDLNPGDLTPVQVTLASRGSHTVALVAMGRPGPDRRGMVFPESRWVEWTGDRVAVFPARAFHPGTTLALEDDVATVLSYARVDPRTPEERASHRPDVDLPFAIAVTQLGPHGRVVRGPNQIDQSDGWQLDSPVVVWQHGAAVVLGRATNPPADSRRREMLHFLDGRGHPVRQPLELSDQSRDDGLGAPIAGLTAAPDGGSLAASWMVPSGPIAGVWVRRGITLDARPFVAGTARISDPPADVYGRVPRSPRWYPRGLWSFRVAQGEGFWGPCATRGAVMFRRTETANTIDAPRTEIMFLAWPANARALSSRAFGSWWDPLPLWSAGGPMIAGFTRHSDSSHRFSVAYANPDGTSLRTIHVAAPSVTNATDIAWTATDSGAFFAWIAAPDDAPRHLEFARIVCERTAQPTSQSGHTP
jgi:hypothetical protein